MRHHCTPDYSKPTFTVAHAAETGRLVLTREAKARFGDLPGIITIDA
jgi:hypothetical protein